MGQRLVFKCIKNGERIATIYYHWSGYTQSIYWEAAELVDWLRNHGYTGEETVEELQKMLLDYLEERGGGASGNEDENGNLYEVEEWAKRGIKAKEEGISRNDGLIDITKRGMDHAEYWAEALEDFNFDDETFTNGEFYNEPPAECDWIENPDGIPEWKPEFGDIIKWDEARDALRWFDSLPRYEGLLGIDPETGCYVSACE